MRITGLFLPLAAVLSLAAGQAFAQSAELRAAHRQVAEHYKEGDYEKALEFAEEAVDLSAEEFGAEHPTTATLIHNMGELQRARGELAAAEQLYNRALAIRQATLDPNHPDLAASNDSLGRVMTARGKFAEAEAHHWEAVRILEQTLARRPHVIDRLSSRGAMYRARALYNRGLAYEADERFTEAESLFDGVVAVFESNLSAGHPDLIAPLEHRAEMLRELDRDAEAAEIDARAAAIRESRCGEDSAVSC